MSTRRAARHLPHHAQPVVPDSVSYPIAARALADEAGIPCLNAQVRLRLFCGRRESEPDVAQRTDNGRSRYRGMEIQNCHCQALRLVEQSFAFRLSRLRMFSGTQVAPARSSRKTSRARTP